MVKLLRNRDHQVLLLCLGKFVQRPEGWLTTCPFIRTQVSWLQNSSLQIGFDHLGEGLIIICAGLVKSQFLCFACHSLLELTLDAKLLKLNHL